MGIIAQKHNISYNVFEMKEYKRLKEDEIKGLHIIEQSQFELYVDMVLQKNYKEVPNVIRLPNISEAIAKMLGSSNMNVYLTKNDFTHFRISRKGTYNQAFREEELKAIPTMIKNACTVYVDKKTKTSEFFYSRNR